MCHGLRKSRHWQIARRLRRGGRVLRGVTSSKAKLKPWIWGTHLRRLPSAPNAAASTRMNWYRYRFEAVVSQFTKKNMLMYTQPVSSQRVEHEDTRRATFVARHTAPYPRGYGPLQPHPRCERSIVQKASEDATRERLARLASQRVPHLCPNPSACGSGLPRPPLCIAESQRRPIEAQNARARRPHAGPRGSLQYLGTGTGSVVWPGVDADPMRSRSTSSIHFAEDEAVGSGRLDLPRRRRSHEKRALGVRGVCARTHAGGAARWCRWAILSRPDRHTVTEGYAVLKD
ncbi:hypothetical protein C2E23DRAFT_281751 [Lenzites betulinus]|nr:hypothetical protein C2E23DRAFT_281751 [Lenzites betulinus]